MNQSQIKKKQMRLLYINVKDVCYWLLLIFLTLPHMKNDYLKMIPSVDLIFDILRGVSFFIIVLWYMLKRKMVSCMVVLVAVWRIFLVYSTFMNEGKIYGSIVESFSIMAVILLYEVAYNNRKATFLSAQLFCFELVIYINLITEFVYPNGLYSWGNGFVYYQNNWFLGLYNTHTKFYFPALMIAWLYKEITRKKIRAYLILTSILISAIRVWSGGTVLSLGLIVVVYTLFKDRTRIFNYYSYWVLHIIFFVFVVLLRLQNYFIWLVNDILGKWSSLISRINLWDKVIALFLDAPIIGHGIQDDITRTVEVGIIFGGHAHNLLLEILYQGGIINLVLWSLIVIVAGSKLYNYRNSIESKIIATAFLGWCVHTLVEPYNSPFLIGMFVIAYRSNRGELGGRYKGRVVRCERGIG